MQLREVNWIGEGTLADALALDRLEVFVKVRSTRRPQSALLSRAGGDVEIELLVGEEGVAPGQACVFYDARAGQARVLGGGIIKSVTSAAEPIDTRPSPRNAAAATRG
jgi:tRNA-specific 2-thiouridylase